MIVFSNLARILLLISTCLLPCVVSYWGELVLSITVSKTICSVLWGNGIHHLVINQWIILRDIYAVMLSSPPEKLQLSSEISRPHTICRLIRMLAFTNWKHILVKPLNSTIKTLVHCVWYFSEISFQRKLNCV